MISGMGSAALLWLVSLPPPPNCSKTTEPMLDMERLYCAQQAIQTGGLPELVAGMEMLKQWTPDDPLYAETQELSEEWSKQILAIARSKVQDSDLKGALDAISHIPKSTQVYKESQEFAAYWKEQWNDAEKIYAKAQAALKQQDWSLASEQVSALAELSNPYWNTKRANELAQQIGVEKRAWQVLGRARETAKSGELEQLGQGIVIAQDVPRKTYAWEAARANLKQWSQTLVTQGIQKWQAGDIVGAANTLKIAPQSSDVPELQDLVWFGNAFKLVDRSTPSSAPSANWIPSLPQIWYLMEAASAMKQVKPDSPFYAQAQSTQKNLEAQVQDLTQLHYAAMMADLGQHATFKLAIEQAQQIKPDRPRRLQAQTLIAYWRDQIEQIEDQPYLDAAIAQAKSGKVNDLRTAIAAASQIKPDRALRRQAQGLIATWTNQIERIEDQPLLNRAWALADEGQLSEAIDVAQTILPGRALYDDAQSAVAQWQAQITRNAQIAEDRPILNQARSLAQGGDLSGAIRVASQIASGRALYGEAQGAIADWQAQLAPPPSWDRWDTNDQDADSLDGKPEKSIDSLTEPGSSPSPSYRPLPPNIITTPPNYPSPWTNPATPSWGQPSTVPAPPEIVPPRIETVPAIEAPPPPPAIDQAPNTDPGNAPSEIAPEPPPTQNNLENPSGETNSSSPFEGYYDQRYYRNP